MCSNLLNKSCLLNSSHPDWTAYSRLYKITNQYSVLIESVEFVTPFSQDAYVINLFSILYNLPLYEYKYSR